MSAHEVGIGSIVKEFAKDDYKSQIFSYYQQVMDQYFCVLLCRGNSWLITISCNILNTPQLAYDLANYVAQANVYRSLFFLAALHRSEHRVLQKNSEERILLIYISENTPYQLCCSKDKVTYEAAVIEKNMQEQVKIEFWNSLT